ncbi:ComEA family DNA-binding protein [Pleionea litopenaei]|uniref:Helix-hairpin-helix domain-containing protein n=1 Tax=Pleionea litopenaei TaxID=3070815 RepID=A0AA51X6V8_9GAMM|nr:helix-hairpin-helix domain-containing protein [Pleionea sp. HL-JVS1]WMS87264.1 helix-hairpin-helix domain-containing protein [Pleionea sp. HL-JVS1]
MKSFFYAVLLKITLFISAMSFFVTAVEANESSTNALPNKTLSKQSQLAKVEAKVQVVYLNKASAEEIAQKLNGVGIKKAQAIIELRNKLGKFKRVEQILDVKGIGRATLEKNQHLLKL